MVMASVASLISLFEKLVKIPVMHAVCDRVDRLLFALFKNEKLSF